MIPIKLFFLLWMILYVNCRIVPYTTEKKCNSTGNSFVNSKITDDWQRGAYMYRKYQCRTDYISNIPDLGDIVFKCMYFRRSASHEWKSTSAWFTEGGSLYLQNVTCEQLPAKKKCSAPPLPKNNMTREIMTSYLMPVTINGVKKAIKDFYTGDTVKYSCKPGFILSSDTSFYTVYDYYDESSTTAPATVLKDITCNAGGLWNGLSDSELFFGECKEIKCNASSYADISNGNITNFKETYEYLEEMELECEHGYRHKGGVKSVLCMTPSSFSEFSMLDLGCERIQCIEPESPSNGFLRMDHNYVDGTVIYECESGYDLIGYSEWRCQLNGKWDHDCIKCASEDAYCSPPCLPPGAMITTSSESYQMGDVLDFTCKSGKYYGGSTNRTCMKNRNWSGTPIDCTAILCPALPQIQHGSIFQDTSDGRANDYESVAEYTCDRDYYLNGNTQLKTVRRTCQSDGKWSGKEPICEVPKCNLIEDFYGGSVEYFSGRDLYSQAFYSCDENYSMIPSNVQHSTCENNLRWEPPPPKCYKQADIYIPNNGYLRGRKRSKVLHDESYTIFCYRGFEVERDGIVPVNKEPCTNIRNNNGTLEPLVDCVEEWCKTDKVHTEYKHENGSGLTSRIPSNEDVWISCEKGYAFYNSRNQLLISPQKRRCVQGQIQDAPTCIEAKSLLAGYPYSQFTIYRDSKGNRLDRETYIEPNEKIEVYCTDGYELYVESNKEYLDEFIIASRYGEFDKEKNKFPVCLEKRCVFEPSKVQGACFATNDETNCKREQFEIHSGSSIHIKCEKGYTLFVSGKEVDGQENIICDKGNYPYINCTANMSTNVNGDISIDEKLAGNNGYKEYIGDREFTLIELDMIVDKRNKRPSRPERFRAIFDKDETKRWQIDVPCEISDGIGDLQELEIRRAISIWELYSCLHFFYNPQVYNRLVFQLGEDNFCGSEVGMKQGPQIIYLGKNCFELEIIVHEIGHALGFYHEHNRWDRDNYIKIHFENINPGYNESFIKRKPENADFDHDYDYLSIMHYGQYFFSKNASAKLITIETRNPNFQSRIGKVKLPSFQDFKTLNDMYKCKDVCAKVECPEGGFIGKQCQCYCKGNPDGSPVRPCFQRGEECPNPFVNKYLFDVKNKDNTSLINMTRASFPNKTILNLFSTNWNCTIASQLRCEGGKWTQTNAECPVALDIKMMDGTEGVVEVTLNDVHRGYICDDDWDDNDATVACKMIGYTKGWAYFQKPQEVNKSLPILLDNVQCSGEELSLADCKHNGWGNHDCEYSEVVSVKCFNDSFTSHIDKTQCGKIKINDSKRKKRQLKVTSGFETIKGMHPWQVEIQRKKRKWIHCCGGTIINNEWILSAAHCFNDLIGKYDGLNAKLNFKDVRVIVGDHDLTIHDEYEKMFHIEYIVKHWNYSEFERKYSNNDIALLKIKSTSGISFNDYIQPACLPEEFTQLSSETKCEVSGWGTEIENGTITDTLRAAEVMINPEQDCQGFYNKDPIDFKKVICAGNGSADTCQGDSGGPLICEINGQSTVIGITSWGKGCSQHKAPGVYTKVSEYVRWINYQISNHRLEEANCEPNCENGGICSKDDYCLCKHFTSGKRCEKVICDDKCFANNGECVGPGKCKFPEGKFGTNCEQRSCKIPENKNMANLTTPKTYFEIGETVFNFTCDLDYFPSSDQGMTCQSDGSWSDIVTCEKGQIYLISTKTEERRFAGTDVNVYITLFGSSGSTRRLYFTGNFEPGDVDEMRTFARDVRPIQSVKIGLEGGISYYWHLEYVSIYVERMEEFYVFRNNQWLIGGNDLTLHREGNQSCINTFVEKYMWYPTWEKIIYMYFRLGRGPGMSRRACKQACINWRKNVCNGFYRDTMRTTCYGFTETRDEYFTVKKEPWSGELFFRTCKKFN